MPPVAHTERGRHYHRVEEPEASRSWGRIEDLGSGTALLKMKYHMECTVARSLLSFNFGFQAFEVWLSIERLFWPRGFCILLSQSGPHRFCGLTLPVGVKSVSGTWSNRGREQGPDPNDRVGPGTRLAFSIN